MSTPAEILVVQLIGLGLTLVQAVFCVVIAHRLVLVSRCGGRSSLSSRTLAFHRGLIFAACGLQLLRCIDPFAVWGIWPRTFCLVIQITVSMTVCYQLTTLSFIMIDTLYACAKKRTPRFLLYVALILPLCQTLLAIIASSIRVPTPGVNAMNAFSGAALVFLNMGLYDGLGFYLVWMLKRHTRLTVTHEEPSTNPLQLVITRTFKSMAFLSAVSSTISALLCIAAVTTLHASSSEPNSAAASTGTQELFFIHIMAEFMFTKLTWLSATQVKDRQQAAVSLRNKQALALPQTRPSRTVTKSELAATPSSEAASNSDSRSEQAVVCDVPVYCPQKVALEIPGQCVQEVASPSQHGEMTVVIDKPRSSSYNELS